MPPLCTGNIDLANQVDPKGPEGLHQQRPPATPVRYVPEAPSAEYCKYGLISQDSVEDLQGFSSNITNAENQLLNRAIKYRKVRYVQTLTPSTGRRGGSSPIRYDSRATLALHSLGAFIT
jgi:hypothetical protein